MADDHSGKSSWWLTLPGVLTGVAGVLTAGGAFVAALNGIGILGQDKSASPPIEMVQPDTKPAQTEPVERKQEKSTDDKPSVKAPPPVIKETFSVERHDINSTGQTSPGLEYKMDIYTTGQLRMKFAFDAQACSKIRLFVYVDDEQKVTTPAFDESTAWLNLGPVAAGTRQLRLVPEGLPGGCNTGRIVAWGGTLTVETTKQ